MSTYKEIYGQNIEILSSDPSNPTLGQIWYNTSTNKLKGFRAVSGGVWSTGEGMLDNGAQIGGAAGTATAALAFGGNNPANSPNYSDYTQKYNGSTWTAAGTMNTARTGLGGFGVQTAALGFGGYSSPPFVYNLETELYNGSSWTNNPSGLPGNRHVSCVFGTQAAGVAAGGSGSPTTATTTVLWNGSSWSNSPNSLNTKRANGSGCGTQTVGLVFAGTNAPDYTGTTEKFNGSTFSATGAMGTARYSLGGFGTQTSALACGGGFPTGGNTEQFNGSTWTNKSNMGSARYGLRGSGNTTNGLAFGGTQGLREATEEWNPEEAIAIF